MIDAPPEATASRDTVLDVWNKKLTGKLTWETWPTSIPVVLAPCTVWWDYESHLLCSAWGYQQKHGEQQSPGQLRRDTEGRTHNQGQRRQIITGSGKGSSPGLEYIMAIRTSQSISKKDGCNQNYFVVPLFHVRDQFASFFVYHWPTDDTHHSSTTSPPHKHG